MRMTRLAAVLAALFLFSAIAGAQTLESGQVSGTVRDQDGAPLPGATVTLSNESTGFSRTVVSNETGAYQFAQIPSGTYEMLATMDSFSGTRVTNLTVNVGASLTLDVEMTLLSVSEEIVVQAAAAIDTSTSGVSQLIDSQSIESLPLLGRDFRDLARLAPGAQITPGLRGSVRLGGQQSDYTGLSIDGGDSRDNFFGENFGSLETKNSVIPIEAIEEFQVVTNGFAPEFGRSTGGLLNVVTKSGTNNLRGSAHWYHRNDSMTNDDWLGTPPNIDQQNQFGAMISGPITQDKQFYLLAFDISDRYGPLVSKFARDVTGVVIPNSGGALLSDLEGSNEQSQELFSILGKWDFRANDSNHLSIRSFYTKNETDGFTGGRGQNQVQASFGNTESFENSGHNTVATWNKVFENGSMFNEMKAMYYDSTRPRQPNSTVAEADIGGVGFIGNRFFLPIDGDQEKITFQDNFQVAFGNHDMKFGADINAYSTRNNLFFGWNAGSYWFGSLEDFEANRPFAYIQGYGFGAPYEEAALQPDRARQTGYGAYFQDQWQAKPNLTVTYGLRWDGTDNPDAISPIFGEQVYAGVGSGSRLVRPPQETPSDWDQWGPRLGVAWSFDLADKPAILRANTGLYYAQTPPIFMNTGGGPTTVIFQFNPALFPPGNYPNTFPDQIDPNDPTVPQGPFDTNYDDPAFRNPRVTNTTVALEWQVSNNYTLTTTGAWADSDYLRTSWGNSAKWGRNFVSLGTDQFGRSILDCAPGPFGSVCNRVDNTINEALPLGSFSRGEFRQVSINLTRRFAGRYQYFINYAWSSNKDNAAVERDTDIFFGPQDPFNINIDFGRNSLDIPNQLKVAGSVDVGAGFMISGLLIARDGNPFPAYSADDTNLDGIQNEGFNNDRPVVGGSRLLERFPEDQPSVWQMDLRVSKEFTVGSDRRLELTADLFNIFDTENKYANPRTSSIVSSVLAAPPKAGDPLPGGGTYRSLNQIAPGTTPFSIQLGVRFKY